MKHNFFQNIVNIPECYQSLKAKISFQKKRNKSEKLPVMVCVLEYQNNLKVIQHERPKPKIKKKTGLKTRF